MSIELKQAAQQALDALEAELSEVWTCNSYHPSIYPAMEALRTAIQQAESEPVYWEWRHQGSHPDAVDFGQWSEWKRVEPRSLLHTVDDALREFKGYIARGSKYELRALYTHPAPGVPDAVARDAERYRWLRENGTLGFSGAPSWRASVSFDAVDAYAQTLDSNIDAAQAQKGQP